MKSSTGWLIGLAIGIPLFCIASAVAVFILTVSGCMGGFAAIVATVEDTKQQAMDGPATYAPAHKIAAAYERSAFSGDDKYLDRKVMTSGIITDTGTDLTGQRYVALAGIGTTDVVCYFSASNGDQLSGYGRGNRITVVGYCEGQTVTQVTLTDCYLPSDEEIAQVKGDQGKQADEQQP